MAVILVATDRTTTLPRHTGETLDRASGPTMFSCPFPVDSFIVRQHWHGYFDRNGGNIRLLGLFARLVGRRSRFQGGTMLNPDSALTRLLHAPMRAGSVSWIGVRPERRQPLRAVTLAELDAAAGLSGDHHRSRGNTSRQVTLIQAEHLAAIASYLGVDRIPPDVLRRNIVVRGINLLALRGVQVRLGSAVLVVTGACHPCSRLEEILGVGGYNAVRGHGGVTARVIGGGQVQLNDLISPIGGDPSLNAL